MAIKLIVKVRKIFAIILISFTLVFTFIYWIFGFRNILTVRQLIKNLPDAKKPVANEMLSSGRLGGSLVGGILLKIDGNKNIAGVWVWNTDGVKRLKASENVEFTKYSICEGQKWEDGNTKVSKSAIMNYKEWYGSLRQGDYLELSLSSGGLIEEISYYDWWVFASPLPYSYFELTCKNR